MKIVHVIECFAGGTFTFLVDLINELNTQKHIIIYGTSRKNMPINFKKSFPSNVTFIEWRNAQRNICFIKDLKALFELYNILKNISDIDVIHLHSSKAGFLGRMVSSILLKSNKVVYTSHAVSFLRLDITKKKKLMFIWMEKIASYFGGKIIACSKSEKDEFLKYGIKNVNYINNGIQPLKEKKKENITKKITIISIGRLSIQKNPKLFNKIAQKFIDNENIQFIWCGDGELRCELISKNIKCTGWINKNEILHYLSSADIYLSTSLWEGLPLSVLEAMSVGVPLVLSNCVGNKDLIKDNGYLYKDINEAIKSINYLKDNKDILVSMQEISKKFFYRNFTINKMGNDYLNLYRSVTEEI